LAIATNALHRLVKEEASYHKELTQQEARLAKALESSDADENKEFTLKQERAAIEETKAVFPPLRERIEAATQKLEDKVADGDGAPEEVEKAKEIIALAKESAKGER
ncbi:tubulin-specific chaperone-like protein Rbl2, partial [Bisporella sp. PMI_857]